MHRRLLTALCVLYAGLLVYASLMPFDFTADEQIIHRKLEGALGAESFANFWRSGRTDVLSNFVLYIPLGFLLTTRLSARKRLPRWLAALAVTVLSASVSAMIELLQAHSLTRVCSGKDVVMNAGGGLVGAVAGAIWGRLLWVGASRRVRTRLAKRPWTLAAAALILLILFDSLCPFLPTINLSQVKRGLRASHLSLMPALAEHAWHHWLVHRLLVFGALTALIGASSLRRSRRRWVKAALLAFGLAAALEICKPFIVSRRASIANVVMSGAGAASGLLVCLGLDGRLRRTQKAIIAGSLLLCYLVYLEWRPFAFHWDPARMSDKLPTGIQWLPLYHYAMGARAEHVRLFIQNLVLTAALTVSLLLRPGERRRSSARWRPFAFAGLMALLGAFLEAGQLLLPGRVPSVTDVFTFGLGGALGAWVTRRLSGRPACERHEETGDPAI